MRSLAPATRRFCRPFAIIFALDLISYFSTFLFVAFLLFLYDVRFKNLHVKFVLIVLFRRCGASPVSRVLGERAAPHAQAQTHSPLINVLHLVDYFRARRWPKPAPASMI